MEHMHQKSSDIVLREQHLDLSEPCRKFGHLFPYHFVTFEDKYERTVLAIKVRHDSRLLEFCCLLSSPVDSRENFAHFCSDRRTFWRKTKSQFPLEGKGKQIRSLELRSTSLATTAHSTSFHMVCITLI